MEMERKVSINGIPGRLAAGDKNEEKKVPKIEGSGSFISRSNYIPWRKLFYFCWNTIIISHPRSFLIAKFPEIVAFPTHCTVTEE